LPKSVLVTGAGRGIGRAIAERLSGSGWDVYAGLRSGDAPEGCTRVQLDVTSADDVAALDGALPATLDAVVNNAGIAIGGPVEAVALDDVRQQFEVNLVGQVAVTQAVLPRLRAARGRAVFISSVSGRISTPMTGVYNASKFALEGLVDAFRLEVRPWGIRVCLVEPAQTDTSMWQDAEAELEATLASMSPEHRELYAKHTDGFRRMIPMSQKLASPADDVAACVEKALTSSRPKARYVVGLGPRVQAAMSGATPTPVLDFALSRALGVPRKA
jgi:NAD(P)-dependent dehydrogenase (short-subunit alcohol dehydrogenase family)